MSSARKPVLQESGERFMPSMDGDIRLEHLHRYHFAAAFAQAQDVLDIACGEGYGSNILSKRATSVVGVDISADAVAHAANRYGSSNLAFKVGSCLDIPIPDDSCDLVVSFETIEHIAEHAEFLREVKRVLRSTGTLILSTPEKANYNNYSENDNPFHVRELCSAELMQLLKEQFSNVLAFSQVTLHGSLITQDRGFLTNATADGFRLSLLEGDFDGHHEVAAESVANYKIAVASNDPIKPAEHGQSLFCGRDIRATPSKSERDEVHRLRQSYTWRIGSIITWPVRYIARFLRKAHAIFKWCDKCRIGIALCTRMFAKCFWTVK